MKKGFFFTLSALSLAFVIFTAIALSQQTEVDPVPLLLSEKVSYAWEDVSEDILGVSGVNITKNDTVLILQDELPAPRDVPDYLGRYVSFVKQFYNTSDLNVYFYSGEGELISDFACFGKKSCTDNAVQFHILPANMTYTYPDWNKKLLDIVCYNTARSGFPACDFTPVTGLNISINLTAVNFSCDPSVWNDCTKDEIQWDHFDKVFGCSSGVGCIPYYLTIRDASGAVYSCQGVYGSNGGNTKEVNCDEGTINWYENDEAKLTFKSQCRVTLKFGNHGRIRIEGKDVDDRDCDVNMTTDIRFTYNNSAFWTDFSTQMQVTDNYGNYSAMDVIR
ncbi:MAG: hypothetical protein V1722_05635 [Candidatus Micrarchaeota archaeon]